ncbi:MAG TPA: dihydrolipoyl dehydrogenase [Noviherbaspirillum sp.]|nr:dihydrolipoyl dehydrogenase [Noviherbaspirillum sp.]
MNELAVDVAIIGAGTAGLAAYKAARTHHGKRVLLIEGGPYGTTCARVGCMPSKLLIAAAEAAHGMRAAPAFGVHPGAVCIDGRAVMARVRSERDRFVDYVLAGIDRIPDADRLRGCARFLDTSRLQVDDHTIVHAGSIVIATGSSPYVPPELAPAGARLVVNDDVFEWEDLPESVAVAGTGIIGLELGQALHRLGVRVALFGRGGRLAQLADPAVLAAATRAFGAELDLRPETERLDVQGDGQQVRIRSRGAAGERDETYSFLLAATGRVPNVRHLCLERTGLALDTRGLPLFDPYTMQCCGSNIFIAGDAGNERPLLHEAAGQGRIAGDNAGRYPDVRPGLRHAPLAVVFTDPQIASVGQGWRSLRPGSFAVGEVSFDNQGRSRVMLQNRGLLRVYGEFGSGRFLGAEMAAPRAEHLAHLLAWACQSGMTVEQMLHMPYYHPVIEEGVRSALRDLYENLLRGPQEIEHCTDCTPGM